MLAGFSLVFIGTLVIAQATKGQALQRLAVIS